MAGGSTKRGTMSGIFLGILSQSLVTTGLVLLTTLGDWTQACKCILSCMMELGLLWPALGYFMVSTKYSVSLSLTNTSLCHHGLVGWWSTWNIGMLWGSTSSWRMRVKHTWSFGVQAQVLQVCPHPINTLINPVAIIWTPPLNMTVKPFLNVSSVVLYVGTIQGLGMGWCSQWL